MKKKGFRNYKFCHWHEYYLNKLGKLKLPNHVKKAESDEDEKSAKPPSKMGEQF